MKREKYRILIVGENKTVLDMFFYHMPKYEVQTVSTRVDDVLSHLKYFQPQAMVYCLVKGDYNGIKKIPPLKGHLVKADIPFICIGANEDCASVDKMIPGIVDTFIEKPFTVVSIQNQINDLIDEREKRLEEARQQEEAEKEEQEKEEQEEEKEAEESEKEENEEEQKGVLDTGKELSIDDVLAEKRSLTRRRHILIVDDDSAMLKVIKEHLKDHYDVATAISGKLARKFLEKKQTDLVLLDYMMPEEDGPAVLKALREDPSTKNLPVVFLTGMTDKGKIVQLLRGEYPPQGYIIKPVEKEKLLAHMKSLIGM